MPLPKSLAPVFLTLAAFGLLQLHGPAARSGREDLRPSCTAQDNPYRLPYTSNAKINGILCILNTLFAVLLAQPDGKALTAYFMLGLGPLSVFLPQLEASRPGRSALLAAPTLIALGGQLAGAGFFMPLYGLFFVLGASNKPVTQAGAERALLSTLAGFLIPTLRILGGQAPTTLATFQVFPLFVLGVGAAWNVARRATFGEYHSPRVAYLLVQTSYVLVAAGSLYAQLQYAFPRLEGAGAGPLYQLFVPVYGRLHNVAPDLSAAAVDFIKWDHAISVAALGLLSLFTVDSVLDIVVFASVVVIAGPGAACALLLALRESRIEDERLAVKEAKKQ